MNRAEIEAKRGIKRDEKGRIIRSKKWLKERIIFLQSKVEDFKRRTKNAQEEIKQREEELKK
jgi:hypothetical protein